MDADGPAPGHYFDTSPAVASARRTVPLVLPDLTLTLTTDRGVFAADRIDPGTRFLLSDGPPLPAIDGPLLDLGCGYGPIAATLARRHPDRQVWAIDVNARAVELCRLNAATLGLTGLHACAPDAVPADLRFAAIWSNPPIRIGKAALHELLTSWLDRLLPEGCAVLVVQKHLGSDSLQRWLAEQGWPTTRLASRAGYRLLEVAARAGIAT